MASPDPARLRYEEAECYPGTPKRPSNEATINVTQSYVHVATLFTILCVIQHIEYNIRNAAKPSQVFVHKTIKGGS